MLQGWEPYNLHDLGQVFWVASALYRSCTTSHDRRLGSRRSTSWSIWSICPKCGTFGGLSKILLRFRSDRYVRHHICTWTTLPITQVDIKVHPRAPCKKKQKKTTQFPSGLFPKRERFSCSKKDEVFRYFSFITKNIRAFTDCVRNKQLNKQTKQDKNS